MNDEKTVIREWYNWQPSRIESAHEAEDWSDFLAWCDKWAGYTERTVAYRTKEEVAKREEPKAPAWCARVYGGKR
jgi:hypothetical protein